MPERIFYVTQSSLSVWVTSTQQFVATFSDDDRGWREFGNYLQHDAEQSSAMLVDLIEEEFSLDSIPKLRASDRRAMLVRRSERKFRRTPYRLTIPQGKSARAKNEFDVLYSAISNHELVDRWMQVILRHRTPLAGLYSIALMAPRVCRTLFKPKHSALFITTHQGDKLRQVFLQEGQLRSARLSSSPGVGHDDYAQYVVTEIMRGRRYLERTRLLESTELLDVCVIADNQTAAKIRTLTAGDEASCYRFADPDTAARRLGAAHVPAADHLEELYLLMAGKRRPTRNYASSRETRYWHMRRLRSALLGGIVAAALLCSAIAAVLFSDTWIVRHRIATTTTQLAFLTDTFRRENESFDSIRANSYEMQLAVDTGNFILDNRIPVPWVMNQLGAVLGDYPDIQVRELRWSAETPDAPAVRRRTGDAPVFITVPELKAVRVLLTADIMAFDGDMRAAFARIDTLVADLQSKTDFSQAVAIEYPFDAHTNAALSGEVVGQQGVDTARFKIRVRYEIEADEARPEEHSDASI